MKVSTTSDIDRLLEQNAPVAIGVSGGKDSTAVAIATIEYLDEIGHTGDRLLIHADLGATEWKESLPRCQAVADVLGVPLDVVRRPQGDMMQRWDQRWTDNVTRYEELSCVQIILPWSTPSMRFCTSELKIDQICRHLSKKYAGQTIINATGIRRQESRDRAKAPVSKWQPKLTSITRRTTGIDWNPIIEWSIEDVLATEKRRGLARHEAYIVYGASRVSCVFCMLATQNDHQAGARAPENVPLGIRMVILEARSTFAFQGDRWLGDTIRNVIPDELAGRIATAKENAAIRFAAEAKIPKHLLYEKGWPTCIPTRDEAMRLGATRFIVADAVGLKHTFINASDIIGRYEELMRLKNLKGKK